MCARACVQKIILGTKRTLEKEPLNWSLFQEYRGEHGRAGVKTEQHSLRLCYCLLSYSQVGPSGLCWKTCGSLYKGSQAMVRVFIEANQLRPAPEAVRIRYSTAETDKPGHICHPNGQLLLIPAGLRRLRYCQSLSVVLQGKAKTADFYVKISPIIKESWNRIEYICLQHPSQITTCVWR